MTEFWSARCLQQAICSKRATTVTDGSRSFVALGDVVLPDEAADIISKGPKHSFEPTVAAHDLLAINRGISSRADQEGRERCLLEGVDALRKTATTMPAKHVKDPTRKVVTFFNQNNLRLLQADRNGGFVVLKEEDFKRRADAAITNNFVRVKSCATRIKSRAAARCKDLELSR
ncbi:hypothetical protein HPB50_012167 [Hyalomma asiaticum]|uniref:Uncharacterized protein n=1 Tax=Hyalomma asiaticum TaxID=266040 RepID=A0ACB7SQD5_HYAAI|nr:hypothetical protein HPB50_012167 [Hyalomma asiaticum]